MSLHDNGINSRGIVCRPKIQVSGVLKDDPEERGGITRRRRG